MNETFYSKVSSESNKSFIYLAFEKFKKLETLKSIYHEQ